MIWRSLLVYILGIIFARFNKRFMAFRTVNNFFLFIFIGSILASSIVGNLFYETLTMATFILFVNWLIVVASFHNKKFKYFIEGQPALLIDNGIVEKKQLARFFISEQELVSILRTYTNTSDISKVEKAYVEPTGKITFVLKKAPEICS